jgi:chromatin segregation and condensation protein Rec8/ScpA/Scc1 (kleisin family)
MGIFLAVLELTRRGRLSTRQDKLFDEIWLEPRAATPVPAAAAPANPSPESS